MMSIFKKIDIFGTSVQLSFQHNTHHQTCCGSIFTLLLVMVFAVAFWIQGQDVIYKSNPNINYNSNGIQPPKFDLTLEQFPIAFGLRNKNDLTYIKADSSTAFDASVFVTNIESDSQFVGQSEIPVKFVECNSNLLQSADSKRDSYSRTQLSFLQFIEENKKLGFLYCLQFDKTNSNASKYFLQNEQNSRSLITLRIKQCASTNPNDCLDKQYNLNQLSLDTLFVDHNLSFTDRENPLQEFVKTESFSFTSNLEKRVSISFQYTEILTEDNLVFNDVTQENQGLIYINKEQDLVDIDQDNSILLSIQFEIDSRATSYRRYYRKLSSVVAEIGGLAKALIYLFGMIVTPFAKIDFQTSLMNEIFCFDEDEEDKDKDMQKQEQDEQIILPPPESTSPGLPNERRKHRINKLSPKTGGQAPPQLFGGVRNSGFGQQATLNIPIQRLYSNSPSQQDFKVPSQTINSLQTQVTKQDNIINQQHEQRKSNTSNFLALHRSSLKQNTLNMIDCQGETTVSINKNRKSELTGLQEFETPEKANGSHNVINSVRGGNEQPQQNNTTDPNTNVNNIQIGHLITNNEIKINDIAIPQVTDHNQIQNTQNGNNNNNVTSNYIPTIHMQNTNTDMNNSILPAEQSPSPIKKSSISKKLKRGFTADQNYISSLLHVYQENQDPDSAKLKKRKSLRKQGDWFLKKIFTPKTGGLIFKAYEYILYFLPFGKIKQKRQQLQYTLEKISDRLDAVFIINKLIEIDKLKMLILNENQLKLFDYMPKPVINNQTKQQQLLKKQEEQQLSAMNNSTIKGLSLRLKSTAQQPEESKFKSTWSILDSEKTTLMKAHEAYQAFNKIKDIKDVSITDQKLISMLDPQILSYFEKTREQNYYQRITENTPQAEGDGMSNPYAANFQMLSQQVIQQQNEGQKRDSSLFQIQNPSNDNLDQLQKIEINLKGEQTKSQAKISEDQLIEESPQNKQKQPSQIDISPEKRGMLLNESIEIAHESYLQNKTVFIEFVPTKNLNTSIC